MINFPLMLDLQFQTWWVESAIWFIFKNVIGLFKNTSDKQWPAVAITLELMITPPQKTLAIKVGWSQKVHFILVPILKKTQINHCLSMFLLLVEKIWGIMVSQFRNVLLVSSNLHKNLWIFQGFFWFESFLEARSEIL